VTIAACRWMLFTSTKNENKNKRIR